MRTFEGALLWITVASYLAGFLLFLTGAVFKNERHARLAWKVSIAAFAIQTLTIAVRWAESGHPPVLGTFEHVLAGSWVTVAIYMLVGRYMPPLRAFGLLIIPFVMLMIGYGIMSRDPGIEPLPPPYQSNWLWVHVTFAWIAYGAYHVSAGVAILYLLKERNIRRGRAGAGWLLGRLPDLPIMDHLISRLIVFGFVAHVVMLGSGAIWAYGLWGRYWGWDPIETWSLISWIIYGISIHMRMTYGWKGKKGAWLSIAALTAVIITFGGIGFVGGVHTPLLYVAE